MCGIFDSLQERTRARPGSPEADRRRDAIAGPPRVRTGVAWPRRGIHTFKRPGPARPTGRPGPNAAARWRLIGHCRWARTAGGMVVAVVLRAAVRGQRQWPIIAIAPRHGPGRPGWPWRGRALEGMDGPVAASHASRTRGGPAIASRRRSASGEARSGPRPFCNESENPHIAFLLVVVGLPRQAAEPIRRYAVAPARRAGRGVSASGLRVVLLGQAADSALISSCGMASEIHPNCRPPWMRRSLCPGQVSDQSLGSLWPGPAFFIRRKRLRAPGRHPLSAEWPARPIPGKPEIHPITWSCWSFRENPELDRVLRPAARFVRFKACSGCGRGSAWPPCRCRTCGRRRRTFRARGSCFR